MQIPAANVAEYLSKLPDDRRKMLEALRKVILKNIDKPFEEGIQYGMIGYYLPHSVYPDGYHCNPEEPLPFASMASQKNNVSLYLFCVYTSPELLQWFQAEWKKTGKRLDMGKSCIRLKKLEDIPLDLIGKLFKKIKAKDFVRTYEEARDTSWSKGGSKKATKKKAAPKKAAAKKKATKKKVTKKAANKRSAAKKAKAKKKR